MRSTILTKEQVSKAIKGLVFKVLTDNYYWTVDIFEWRKIAVNFLKTAKSYQKDKYDCDDFATNFKCFCVSNYGLNAIGIVIDWISRHAYNCIVDSTREFYLLEPQTGDIFTLKKRRKRSYFYHFSIVLF